MGRRRPSPHHPLRPRSGSPRTECDKIAATIDLLPTFAKLAGTQAPNDRVLDGIDISHLFRGSLTKPTPIAPSAIISSTTSKPSAKANGSSTSPALRIPPGSPLLPQCPHRPEGLAGFEDPFLVNLEADPGETKSVAADHPQVLKHLLALAEEARADIGDYNRVGKNMRFFDPMEKRPKAPFFPRIKSSKPRKKK